MIRAHSLLYAVYVCLIVSIICGALLYFSSLYTMLNQFYNSREDLYIQNQSALNYALSNGGDPENDIVNQETGITSSYEIKAHGLLNVIVVKSSLKNDTITSAHFVGRYTANPVAIFLSKFSNPLYYSGNVALVGDKILPTKTIQEKIIDNAKNHLTTSGKMELSESVVPALNEDFEKVFQEKSPTLVLLKDIERNKDSVYFNSFLNKTIAIQLQTATLQNITMKGNFILYAKDSITINANNVLEDVIIKSPVIKVSKGFKGNIQAFATKKIAIADDVFLTYPSVLAVYNPTADKSEMSISANSTVHGAVVLFGTPLVNIDNNTMTLQEKSLIVGDVYCTGALMINGSIYGSAYTNRFFSQTVSSTYENCIINAEINVTKRPDYFISISLFKNKNERYGVFKKAL